MDVDAVDGILKETEGIVLVGIPKGEKPIPKATT